MNRGRHRGCRLAVLLLVTVLLFPACSRRGGNDRVVATDPKAAASGLEASFQSAPEPVGRMQLASEAMRQRNTSRRSFPWGRCGSNPTLDQGMAIGAVVSMEAGGQAVRSGVRMRSAYDLLRHET
jgi:hypothetical protein